MTSPHVPSDDTAIAAAHDKALASAQASFMRWAVLNRDKPTRINFEGLRTAWAGLHDEWVEQQHRGGGISHAYGPGEMPAGLREAGCEEFENLPSACAYLWNEHQPQLLASCAEDCVTGLAEDCPRRPTTSPPAADLPAAGVSGPAEGRGAFSNVPMDDAMARAEAMFSGQPVRLVPRHADLVVYGPDGAWTDRDPGDEQP